MAEIKRSQVISLIIIFVGTPFKTIKTNISITIYFPQYNQIFPLLTVNICHSWEDIGKLEGLTHLSFFLML